MTLAAADDVAHELGLEDADDLSASQTLRVPSLLARTSYLFQQAADRRFTLDSYIVRLKVNAGRIRLPESPIVAVHSVVDNDGACPPKQDVGTVGLPAYTATQCPPRG